MTDEIPSEKPEPIKEAQYTADGKLAALTDEQWAMVRAERDHWFKVGSVTDPADRPRAERAVADCYKEVSIPLPEITWVDSPLQAQKLIREKGLVSGTDVVWPWHYGSMWAYWIGYYVTCGKLPLRRPYTEQESRRLAIHAELAQSIGWLWCYRALVIAAERPDRIHWDDQVRPAVHCESGPAIRYRDGWSVWAWHGHRVSKRIIEAPETITVEEILNEVNAETRRVMVDRYGVERFLVDAGAEVVAVDTHEHNGMRALMRVRDRQWLCVADPSTGRTYDLAAPDNATTPEEADQGLWQFRFEQIGRT